MARKHKLGMQVGDNLPASSEIPEITESDVTALIFGEGDEPSKIREKFCEPKFTGVSMGKVDCAPDHFALFTQLIQEKVGKLK